MRKSQQQSCTGRRDTQGVTKHAARKGPPKQSCADGVCCIALVAVVLQHEPTLNRWSVQGNMLLACAIGAHQIT
jgi:hypothetical protein